MAENEKKGGNIGCLIVVILFVIGSLVVTFMTTSKEEFAEMGYFIMAIAGLVAAYFILKKVGILGSSDASSRPENEDSENKSFLKGCLIVLGLLLFFGIVAFLFSSSMEVNYIVGIIAVVAFALLLGILFYRNMKDN